jgi:hypothetical protein
MSSIIFDNVKMNSNEFCVFFIIFEGINRFFFQKMTF